MWREWGRDEKGIPTHNDPDARRRHAHPTRTQTNTQTHTHRNTNTHVVSVSEGARVRGWMGRARNGWEGRL